MDQQTLTTMGLLIRLWPLLVGLLALAAAWGAALYRINEQGKEQGKFKRCLFQEDGALVYMPKDEVKVAVEDLKTRLEKDECEFLKTEAHTSLCKIVALELATVVSDRVQESESKMIREFKEMLGLAKTDLLKAINGGVRKGG